VLMMLPRRDENVVLSIRNVPTAKVQHVSSINVIELLKHDYVIMPVQTVRWIELVFGEGLSAEEASRRIAEEEPQTTEPTASIASKEASRKDAGEETAASGAEKASPKIAKEDSENEA
jgi:hypothetical protein